MAIKLTITVADPNSLILSGYTDIKVYRSVSQTSGFSEITAPTSMIALQATVYTYSYIDEGGTTGHWYRTTYFDGSGESAFSTTFAGEFYDISYSSIIYPQETVLDSDTRLAVETIRVYIGDPKELTRDYVSIDTGYDSISPDKKTHTLTNPKGWPVQVIKDGIEYTSESLAHVNDYQYVTFSGSEINTVSGTLDVWYHHFRHSDSELARIYNGLLPPPGLTTDDVTFPLAVTMASVQALEMELREFLAVSSSKVDIFEEIAIDPSAGIGGRLSDLKELRKKEQALIDEIVEELEEEELSNLRGVLID